MATLQFSGSIASRNLPSVEGLRLLTVRVPSAGLSSVGLNQRCFPGLVVKAATVVAPKVFLFPSSWFFISLINKSSNVWIAEFLDYDWSVINSNIWMIYMQMKPNLQMRDAS